MAADIQLKRSSVPGKAPISTDLVVGEPVVNLNDKILYTKDGTGNVIIIGAGTTSNITEGTNLYFTNARVSTAISTQTLTNATFTGDVVAGGVLKSTQSSGDEGGEIILSSAVTNTTITGNVAIDIYQNRVRIFETGGSNRGVYIDLTAANTGVDTNLLTGGGGGSGTITNVAGVNSGSVSNAQLASGITSSGILTTANVTEVTNLYFSNARAYSNATTAGFITSSSLTTANVTEVTNLYFSNARAYSNSTTAGFITSNSLTYGNITTRVVTTSTTSGNIIPTANTADQYNLTGLTGNITVDIPMGTASEGQKLILKIKDNGNARSITWITGISNSYRVIGSTLPSSTTANKTIYVGLIYNNPDSRWDVVAVATET